MKWKLIIFGLALSQILRIQTINISINSPNNPSNKSVDFMHNNYAYFINLNQLRIELNPNSLNNRISILNEPITPSFFGCVALFIFEILSAIQFVSTQNRISRFAHFVVWKQFSIDGMLLQKIQQFEYELEMVYNKPFCVLAIIRIRTARS